jgi:hypothetical protein
MQCNEMWTYFLICLLSIKCSVWILRVCCRSCVMTDDQSTSLSWCQTPIWGSGSNFYLYYCQTVVSLLMWGSLSDERVDLSLTVAAGPRQRSYFRVSGPWDLLSYFTVSNSRPPPPPPERSGLLIYIPRNGMAQFYSQTQSSFSSLPTSCRATVEVFEPACTQGCVVKLVMFYTGNTGVCAIIWYSEGYWKNRPSQHLLRCLFIFISSLHVSALAGSS